ncbi:MAG: DUF1761 domain-containing protein [Chloroflexi bacterium]|nr:DUF1761 domain-containing protein [Chloroflexota bacterium]MBI3167625.1 DUF1761 domain-containing protein [Chloroflexota bacterium]
MDFSTINWLAVVVCVVASMIIGGAWFAPKTFFPAWWKAIGKEGEPTMGDAGAPGSSLGMGMVWGGVILASFIQAVFMSLMVNAMGSISGGATLGSGALAGFLLWLGFIAPSSLTNKLFADRLKAWVLEQGNHLITFVVMGAIVGAMS